MTNLASSFDDRRNSEISSTDLGEKPGIGHGAMRFLFFAIIGAIAMPWLVYRSLNHGDMWQTPVTSQAASAAVSSANVVGEAAEAVKNTATLALGGVSKTTLPDGTELNVSSQGLESRLARYLSNDPEVQSGPASFDFDRLAFETGKANLLPTSQEQLRDVARILKAYPNASVEIAGYANDAQNTTTNQRLSSERAKRVAAQLVNLGMDPLRLRAKGYGEGNAAASNAVEQGQKDSRTSIIVTKK